MLSARHQFVGLLALILAGLWSGPSALAQAAGCSTFDPSQPRQELATDNELENFGFSLALDGEILAVGAPGSGATVSRDSPSGQTNNRGRVYLFAREGTDWRQQAVLGPVASEDSEIQFGRAVALSGDLLAVGAPEEAVDDQEAAGRVDLFERDDGGTWNELRPPLTAGAANVRAGAKFGFSLGLDGDLLVIGAPFDPTQGRFAGAVFVFRRSGNDWTLETGPLTARDTAAFDTFGTAVAASDGRFVVGAPLHDEAGERGNSGAAYLFEPDGQGGWVDRKVLPREGPAEDDLYGFAVALDGGTAVVGARAGDTDRGADTGAAFVFACGSAGCVEQSRLAACDGRPGDELGAAVAIFEDSRVDPAIDDGDLVVVGARRNDGGGDPDRDSGAAYIYRLLDGTWTLEARMAADSPGPSDQAFGRAVAVAGPHVVAGESLRGERNVGSAHVLTAQADLGVTELGSDVDPVPGTEVTHHVTLRNEGPSPAIGAEVTVTFARKDPASATGPLLSGLTGECCQDGQCTEMSLLPTDPPSSALTALVDLFPGGEVSCTVRPLVAPDARGELIATAVITPPPTVEEPQSEELPNSQELTSPLQPRADLVLMRTSTPGVGVPGGNPNLYRFTVTNGGPSDVLPGEALVTTDFTVSEPGSGPLFIEWSCTPDRGSCQTDRNPGDVSDPIALQAGGELIYEVRVRAGPSDRGRLEGELAVEAMGSLEDTDPSNDQETVGTRLQPRADLLITLDGPGTAVPGDDAPSAYTLAVTNQGPSALLRERREVAMQSRTDEQSIEEIVWTCTPLGRCSSEGQGDIEDVIGLAVNGQLTYRLEISYTPEARGEAVTSALTAALEPARFRLGIAEGSVLEALTRFTPRADLAVAFFEGPETAVPGARDPITYGFRVTHVGGPSAVLAGEAEVAANFDEELADIEWSCSAQDGECRPGGDAPEGLLRDREIRLDVGGSLVYDVSARVRAVVPPEIRPVVRASASVRAGGDLTHLDPSDDQQTLETPLTPVDLALVKTRLEAEEFGGERVYCSQVVNPAEEATAEGIRLFDPSPPGLRLMQIVGTCPLEGCPSVPETVDCSAFPCELGDLTAGGRVCLTARFQVSENEKEEGVPEATPIVNLASLTSTTADPDATNNFDEVDDASVGSGTEESQTPQALSLTLVEAPIRIDDGSDSPYEIDVNPGSVTTPLRLDLEVTSGEGVTFRESQAVRCEAQEGPPCEDTMPLACVEPGSSPCLSWQLPPGESRIRVILKDVRKGVSSGIVERFLRSRFEVVIGEVPGSNDGSNDETLVGDSVEVLTGIGDREPADLALVVRPESPDLGDATPVTLRITNAGPGPAAELRVVEVPGSDELGGRVELRDDATPLCEVESVDPFVCLLGDPNPLVPGSVVLLPVTLDLDPDSGPVTLRVTTDAPDPQDDNHDVVPEPDQAPASAQPASLVPRRLGHSGPP